MTRRGIIIFRFFWCVLLLGAGTRALPAADATTAYIPRMWQVEDGLPHNSVYAITQGQDGHMWLGSPAGLVRFDGARFQIRTPTNISGFSGQMIRALLETRDGTLWFGSDEGGLFSCRDSEIKYHPQSQGRRVRCLLEGKDGTLWVGTSDGLGRYRGGKMDWFTRTNGLHLDNFVLSLCEDKDGRLWIGTNRGLQNSLDGTGDFYNLGNQLPANSIRSLLSDKDGRLWIGTISGLVCLEKGRFTSLGAITDPLISALYEDRHGQLWIGTLAGLYRRSGDGVQEERTPDGDGYGTVFDFAEDHEGNMWIATKEGLTQLRQKPFSTLTRQQGLTHNNAMAICQDNAGDMWFATWGGGVNQWRNGLTNVYNRNTGGAYDLLLSVLAARDGSVWFGSDYDGGLFHVKDGALTRFGSEEGLTDKTLRVLYEDRAGSLWVGTSESLLRWRDGHFDRFTKAHGLGGNIIRCLTEDRAGTLWVGTDGGLSRWQNGRFTNYTTAHGLAAPVVLGLHPDADGSLWLGTDGGGLQHLRDGRFTTFTKREGLYSDDVFEIVEDAAGNFWMTCFSGIFRVKKSDLLAAEKSSEPARLTCVTYGKWDGMASAQCRNVSKPSICRSRDGRLWFATTRGIAVYDPAQDDPAAHQPPQIVVEEISSEGQSVPFVAGGTATLSPGHSDLRFLFAALSFRYPERNRYQYRLIGADDDWQEPGSRPEAQYNNLSPGRYQFEVRAANSLGVWNRTGATVTVELLPYFWQTRTFLVLLVLSGLGGAAFAARAVTRRRLQRKFILLEQQNALEKERNRIARDMHDDLGARLTEILLVSDQTRRQQADPARLAPNLDRISTSAREVIDSLDALIWAVNPGNDSLDKLAIYINEFAQTFLDTAHVACRFDIPENLPPVTLSSEVRHNLFLLVKEILNNLAKHAQASEAWIRLRVEDNTLLLAIEDNGRGFARDAVSSLGNGLQNMEKRARSIGGEFTLETAPGKGTAIRLKVPIRPVPPTV